MVRTLDDATAATIFVGDLEVRRMGFGAMRLTGEGIWGEPDDLEAARQVLRRVVDLGVNFIDTADSYGPEVSERLIAEALHPYPDDVVIATKGGYERTGPGQWQPNCRPDHLKAACESSLRRLKLETIDLYQLHTTRDEGVPYEESVGALTELREEGKIRHIGVSQVEPHHLDTARDIAEVVAVQNRYNLIERGHDDVLEICERDGLAFIAYFPLGASKLVDADDPGLQQLADYHKATTAQLALAWLLHRSQVTLPIPGTSSIDHLEENVAAAEIRLSDHDVEVLDRLGR